MKKSKSLFLRWKLPYVALAGIAFALITVFGESKPEVKVPPIAPPKAAYVESTSGIGVVEPKSELISIGVELAGVVRDVSVKIGDQVKKGAVLFALDQRDIDAQIATLERSLEAAKVQAADASAQFAIVSSIQDKRAVAKDDFNRRKFGKELAVVRIEEIKAQLNQAKTTKERLIVKAPIDGQVLEVNVRPGEFASTGSFAQPLMRMGDISTLHVRVEIDEESASNINPRSSAQGLARGDTSNPIPLTFVRFEPYVKPKQNLAVAGQRVDTRVLQVLYALPENTPAIFVGRQMDVFINSQKAGTK
jgi:HlyD family secretion protein